MGLLDLFRRNAIADRAALEDFIDSRSAFLAQKCVFEYSRARAGLLWNKLFKERDFLDALEDSRWRTYPIAMANVVEMVEGRLRPHTDANAPEVLTALVETAQVIMHRYAVPPRAPETFWHDQADWLAERLRQIQIAPPRAVKDIPKRTAQEFFDLLPIHTELRGHDFELVQNHQRSNLCRVYEDFVAVADLPVLVDDLLRPRPQVRPPGIAGAR